MMLQLRVSKEEWNELSKELGSKVMFLHMEDHSLGILLNYGTSPEICILEKTDTNV